MVICKENISSEEKELNILRKAVDFAEEKVGKKILNSPEIKRMIEIVEMFLRNKKCICYGGTAINNLLPLEDQFYNKDIEIPDYDFFSPNAMEDAKELADIYHKEGYQDVEAKAGQHFGTYKVFVNFIPIADITRLDKKLFNSVFDDSVKIDGIYYAPPNFLRMSLYLELSRPAGDVSRWEKIFKRLNLLNKNYPLKEDKCDPILFMNTFEDNQSDNKNLSINQSYDEESKYRKNDLYNITKRTFISRGLVFFGGYAFKHYQKIDRKNKYLINHTPDFDVLSEDPRKSAEELKERLKSNGYRNIKIIERDSIGEIIPVHYEIKVEGKTIAFIYEPVGCHSYNILNLKGENIKIASIDTMLSFFLAFIYANRPYYDKKRILCMAEYLLNVQKKNKYEQKGILRRFSVNCYGTQLSKEDIRAEKAEKYKELKERGNYKDFQEYFLNYNPADKDNADKDKNTNKGNKSNIKMYKTKNKLKTKVNLNKSKSKSKPKRKTIKTRKIKRFGSIEM
jgi:hypothetical protein